MMTLSSHHDRGARFGLRTSFIALTTAAAVGIATAGVASAQANNPDEFSINLNGTDLTLSAEPETLTSSATDAVNLLVAAAQVVDSVNNNGGGDVSVHTPASPGADVAVAATENADSNIKIVILDPTATGAPIGTEITGQEDYLESLDKPNDVGQTADGRTVIFPTKGRFTSGYGPRGNAHHNGIDIANSIGTPIRAVMDGTVIAAGPAQGYGNWVVLQHDNGEKSVYGHMAVYHVSVGQRVNAGDTIALMGNEGRSTGPHLHFEIWPDGSNPVDPAQWFADQGISVNAARQ